jgi:hypothetical protein
MLERRYLQTVCFECARNAFGACPDCGGEFSHGLGRGDAHVAAVAIETPPRISVGRKHGAPRSDASTDVLLDTVQRQTLRYFWDFGHPTSGLARERSKPACRNADRVQ